MGHSSRQFVVKMNGLGEEKLSLEHFSDSSGDWRLHGLPMLVTLVTEVRLAFLCILVAITYDNVNPSPNMNEESTPMKLICFT